jgi:hypothetical protein
LKISLKRKLYLAIEFESEKQRRLNAIVIKQTDDQQRTFPTGHLTQISRKYKNQTFNQEIVSKINSEFENFRFVNQIKYPKFCSQKTALFMYIWKRNSNTLTGSLDSVIMKIKDSFQRLSRLTLENSLHVGEQFSLYWKTDGNKQRTFKTALELLSFQNSNWNKSPIEYLQTGQHVPKHQN